MPTLRTTITKTRPATRLVWDIVLEVTLAGGPSADRTRTGGVPDLGQVPELDSRIVTAGGEPVVAVLGAQGVQLDDQVRSRSGRPQPPGPQPARRAVPRFGGEAEPGPVPASGRGGGAGPRTVVASGRGGGAGAGTVAALSPGGRAALRPVAGCPGRRPGLAPLPRFPASGAAPGLRAGRGCGPAAAVERGMPVPADHRHAPAGPRVPRRLRRQVPGQPRI